MDLSTLLGDMRVPPVDGAREFYAFTLTADESGAIFCDTQSIWTGYADDARRIEIRQPRLVSMEMGNAWQTMGQPFVFVKDADHLVSFFLTGGHALIVRNVAEKFLPNLLTPGAACQIGERGFVDESLVERTAFKKAPTPKLRMKVLNRDRRRCRICGRSPDANTDIVLNLHHIRPWALRGLTDLANLITLCHTCHRGLDPHYDPSLFGYIRANLDDKNREFLDGIAHYRRAVILD